MESVSPNHIAPCSSISSAAQVQPLEEVDFAMPAPQQSTLEKVKKVAYNILSVIIFPIGLVRLLKAGLHRLAALAIVPAQHMGMPASLNASRALMLQQWEGQRARIKTEDGVTLDAVHIPGRDTEGNRVPQNAPTVILFNGNSGMYEVEGQMLEATALEVVDIASGGSHSINAGGSAVDDYRNAGFNVVMFNYRGVGASEGKPSRDGLIKDGRAMLGYVRSLGVPDQHITAFGWSLGGGVAAQVAKENPTINYGAQRTFRSLSKTVESMFNGVIGKIAGFLVRLIGWELNSVEAWRHIRGRKFIFHNPEDQLIGPDVALGRAVQQAGFGEPVDVIRMRTQQEGADEYWNRYLINSERPVSDQVGEHFRLGYARLTANEHCRPLTPSERQQVIDRLQPIAD